MKDVNNRIVITGIGLVSPFGIGLDSFKTGIYEGKNTVSAISRFNQNENRYGCLVKGFEPAKYVSLMELRKCDDLSRYAVVSSMIAAEDAGLEYGKELNQEIGVIMGTAMGGINSTEAMYRVILSEGPSLVNPKVFPNTVLNQFTGQVCRLLKYGGVSSTISSQQASGLISVGYAYNQLKLKKADVILSGGAEYLSEILYTGYRLLGKLTCKPRVFPFDQNSFGLILSEGSGVIVLERLESALKRSAKIYAEVIGYANTFSAKNKLSNAQMRAMSSAIKDADLQSDEIDFVVASANGSECDKNEMMALEKVFDRKLVPVSSIKSMIGEGLGASGAWNLITGILALVTQQIPGTINLETIPSYQGQEHVVSTRKEKVNTVLVNSFDSAGSCSSLVIKKWI